MLRLNILFVITILFTTACLKSDKPPEDPSEKKAQSEKLDLCTFPSSLKRAIEQKLNLKCSSVTSNHLAQIKQLTIKKVSAKEVSLLDKKYASYFISLEDVDISNNPDVKALPKFLMYIPGLKKLNVSSTGIRNFPGEICNLENSLTMLIAANNNYEGQEVPVAVFCLSTLKVLDMSNSSLRYIDEYIFYLKELEELYLKGNNLMAAPVVLHMMPSLLVLDLRDNDFANEWVNVLHDCKTLNDSVEQEECQEELLYSVKCEYWHEVPDDFVRAKQSFLDRYTEMTDEPYKTPDECLECNACYNSWINDYVFYNDLKAIPFSKNNIEQIKSFSFDPNRQYLFDLTINGKTMREWRLALDEWDKVKNEHWDCQFNLKAGEFKNSTWKSAKTAPAWKFIFNPEDRDYGVSSEEVFPERYRSPNWERPSTCKPIRYDTPIAVQHTGPWSKALPAVQAVIDRRYPVSVGCEYWETSICPKTERIPFIDAFFGSYAEDIRAVGTFFEGISDSLYGGEEDDE